MSESTRYVHVPLPLGALATINTTDRVVAIKQREFGPSMYATRDVTPENVRTAVDLGYDGTPDGVWRALVEHELLHVIVPFTFQDQPSLVVRHESGEAHVPYHDRVLEEAIVLAAQRARRWLGVVNDRLTVRALHPNVRGAIIASHDMLDHILSRHPIFTTPAGPAT